MHEPVYELHNVEKTRTKGGVSFTLLVPDLVIRRGEFVAIVGPSGCGKSTLLDLLALVLQPTRWADFSINLRERGRMKQHVIPRLQESRSARIRRKHIGYVLQNGGLLPFLTVRENILLMAEISGTRPPGKEFDTLVNILGLGDQLDKKPQYLSGGQRQRVAVARALIHRPAIVLADEPTAAVDYPTALDIRDELKALAHEAGAAVVMVTHDHSLVRDVSDMEVRFDVVRQSRAVTRATTSVTMNMLPSAGEHPDMRIVQGMDS